MRRLAVAAVLALLAPSLMGEPPAEDWDRWQVAAGGDWRLEYNLSRDYGLQLAGAEHPGLPDGIGAAMPWIQGRTTDPDTIADWERFGRPQETANRRLLGENFSKYNRAGEGGQASEDNLTRVNFTLHESQAGIHFRQEKVIYFFSYSANETPEPRVWSSVDYWFNATPPLFRARASFFVSSGSNPLAQVPGHHILPLRLAFPAGQPWLNTSGGWQPLEREGNATIPAGEVAGLLAQSGGNIVVESDRELQAYWMRDRGGEWLGPPEGDYYWPPWLDNESLADGPLALWLLASFNTTDDWELLGDGLWRIAFNVTLRGGLPDLELAVGELPQPLWEEWPATVDVTVANTGAVTSPATLLAADWGANSSQLPVPSLAPGASHLLRVEFAPLLAHPWLNLTVDPGNAILERDETDNFRSVALPVRERLPDFVVVLSVSHRTVLEGQPLEATVTVSNLGNRESDQSVAVQLRYSPSGSMSTAFPLAVGESRSVTWALELPLGTHTLRAVADAGNWFREFDEENNVAELEVSVIASGSGVPSFAASPAQLLLAALVAAVASRRAPRDCEPK